MMQRATGSFEVSMTPLDAPDARDGTAVARLALDKQYHGDLQAVGTGQMLTAMTGTEGSAAYVAIERVTGTLQGRRGRFVLQHSGTMRRGAQQLSIAVVPDSGSGGLAGLSGTFTISVVDGRHFYDLEYSLPA
jgi:hypothetical protein